jgi:LacI family transcriptional regulator
VDENLIAYCGTRIEDGYTAARDLLAHHPTALVTVNDLLALGALRAAADCGRRVPDDLSVASFDDIAFARYVQPRLTTVGVDATALGRAAAQMIFRRLSDPARPTQHEVFPGHLIVRDSTGPAPSPRNNSSD